MYIGGKVRCFWPVRDMDLTIAWVDFAHLLCKLDTGKGGEVADHYAGCPVTSPPVAAMMLIRFYLRCCVLHGLPGDLARLDYLQPQNYTGTTLNCF